MLVRQIASHPRFVSNLFLLFVVAVGIAGWSDVKFIPSNPVRYFSVASAVLIAAIYWFIYNRESSNSNGALEENATQASFKRWFLTLFCFAWGYCGVVSPIPQLLTSQIGEVSYEHDVGQRIKHYGIRSACDYSIRLDNFSGPGFVYCIGRDMYRSLPDEPFEVVVQAKNSNFGRLVQNVEFILTSEKQDDSH